MAAENVENCTITVRIHLCISPSIYWICNKKTRNIPLSILNSVQKISNCNFHLLSLLCTEDHLLSGSIVTMTWQVFQLQVKMKASRYGGQLQIYWINNCGQLTRGGPPACMLNRRLQCPTVKQCEIYPRPLTWADFFWNNLSNGKLTWAL
jgi:hypothetical protein